MHLPRLLVLAFAVVAAASAACTTHDGTSSGDMPPQPEAGPTVTCQTDPRVDTYVADLTKTSSSGKLKITLVASDPAPPVRGTNTWTVKVADGGGTPIDGATLTVTPFMPDHGHGTSVKAAITPMGGGTYEIAPLYLFMPGVWRVTIANGADSVDFFFCVAG